MLIVALAIGAATIAFNRVETSFTFPFFAVSICFMAAGVISIAGHSSAIASGVTAGAYLLALICGLFIGDGSGVLLPWSLVAAGMAVIYLIMAVYQMTRLEKA